ncbi:TonB-dependent receptor [Haliea sp. E17]|uniref:TonB-dependent receptor n=1 Tax=Haliea sp. E17 TaxID=3401576 RepID=UPI003AB0869A
MKPKTAAFPTRGVTTAARFPAFALGAAGLLQAATLAAQPMLEEVMVTAQKRPESLQDVPISVAAMSGERLDAMGIESIEELTLYTPGVTVTEGASGAQLFIRGVGSGLNKGFEQSVGTYVDGIYFGRGRSTRVGMFDMERAEILKGPQGVLFGKNTIAGAFNLTTRNPGQEAEGYAQASYEFETEEQSYEGAYGGPVTDTLGLRFAARYSDSDGWMRNTFTGEDIGGEEEWISRLTAVWDAADSVEVIGKLQYSTLEQSEKPAELIHCAPQLQALVAGVDDCRFDDKTTVTAYDPDGGHGSEEIEAWSAGLTVNWDFGAGTLTSVTGYTGHDDDLYLDSDYTHLDTLDASRDEKFNSFSQELRVVGDLGERMDYIAGVYYESNELEYNQVLSYNAEPSTGTPYALSRVVDDVQDTKTYAAFGQLGWDFTDTLKLTVGARYSVDEKEVDALNYCGEFKTSIPSGAASCFGAPYHLKQNRSDDNFSPSVTLEWSPTIEHMLYAKVSQGYKSGGFDLQSLSGDPATFEFEPEEVDSYEIGSKSTLLDGAMTLNVAVYRNEYKDLQVSTFDGFVGFNVGNAAEAISQGVDLDLNWAITESWRTAFSVSYLDATYDSFPGAQCSYPQTAATPAGETCVNDLSGEDLQYAPPWSAHWNLTWERAIADNLYLAVSGDLNYSDKYYVANDLDPELRQDSFTKFDMRVALSPLDDRWEVALLGKNLTDEETFNFGNDVPLAPGSYFAHYDRTRTLAVQLRWNF